MSKINYVKSEARVLASSLFSLTAATYATTQLYLHATLTSSSART